MAVIAKSVAQTLWHCARALTVTKLVDACPICRRPKVGQSEFCSLHFRTIKNIEEQYTKWCKAFDRDIDRLEYYANLLRLEETGNAVRAAITYLKGNRDGPT